MINVYRYEEEQRQDWDNLVLHSINGTFLHNRSYMEYHHHLFSDHSLMVEWEGKLVCVMPAHEYENVLYSHQGLTFGGIIIHPELSSFQIYIIVAAILEHAQAKGYDTIVVKQVPSIYATSSQGILEHAYFILGAELISRDFTSAIPLPMDINTWEHGKRWGLHKAQKSGLRIEEEYCFENFWDQVLVPNLWTKFNASPVHSAKEISWLAENNEGHIRQFNVYLDTKIVGGMTIFETRQLARTQYISATPEGKKLHALDLLIHHLGTKAFSAKNFIDMGTSHELQGRKIKQNLLYWKESFGALPYVQDTYKISTSAYPKLIEI